MNKCTIASQNAKLAQPSGNAQLKESTLHVNFIEDLHLTHSIPILDQDMTINSKRKLEKPPFYPYSKEPNYSFSYSNQADHYPQQREAQPRSWKLLKPIPLGLLSHHQREKSSKVCKWVAKVVFTPIVVVYKELYMAPVIYIFFCIYLI